MRRACETLARVGATPGGRCSGWERRNESCDPGSSHRATARAGGVLGRGRQSVRAPSDGLSRRPGVDPSGRRLEMEYGALSGGRTMNARLLVTLLGTLAIVGWSSAGIAQPKPPVVVWPT